MSKQEELIGKGLEWAPAIQHPLDRMYLKKIEGIPLLPKIMGWVVDRERENIEAKMSGDGFLVSEESCPKAWKAYFAACKALDLDPMKFRIFVEAQGELNAYMMGSEIPIIVATRGLVEACTHNELVFVLGHELGHYICGHSRCHSLAHWLTNTADAVGGSLVKSGVGAVAGIATMVATSGIRPLLMAWSRYSELSADRAGLLACRDFETASSAFLKLSGYPSQNANPESPSRLLKAQNIEYAKVVGKMSLARRLWRGIKYSFGGYSHPRSIERFAALDEWCDLGYFDELVNATTEERVHLAADVSTDYLRNELNLLLVETTADYIIENNIADRKTAFSLLRKAFLHGGSLRDTRLERLLYAELSIAKGKGNNLSYLLSILLNDGNSAARKVALPVDYTPDWDFAPDGIRAKFIESRQKELKVLVYKP